MGIFVKVIITNDRMLLQMGQWTKHCFVYCDCKWNIAGNVGYLLCTAVMEYIPCGELFALWKKLHNFSDSLVRLYVAELGMVLGLSL